VNPYWLEIKLANFSAQDVSKLRQATGAGMLDAKKALDENDGNFEAAQQWLREKGLASAAKRADRENSEGAVALAQLDNRAALVELRCETDFVAKSADFVNVANDLAAAVAEKGENATNELKPKVEELNITLKENIDVGRIVRFEAPAGNIIDGYLHIQNDRGKNGVLVELNGGTKEIAHDIAVHIAFARPQYLKKEDVPADVIEAERATFETIAKNEGKPEAALPKIVEGRIQGFLKEVCLLEQPWVKDEKQTISQLLGAAELVRFAQIEIGQ
jgi:elongation factor Ts